MRWSGGIALAALSLSAALASSAAIAGDLELPPAMPVTAYKAPPPRAFSWDGFYFGANAGGHWGRDKITTATDVGWVDGGGAAGGAAIDAASPVTLNPTGFIGGLQVGWNLQGTSGNVFGIEVDLDWLGGTATRSLSNIPVILPTDVLTNTVQASFLSTYRLRWGTTIFSDRALFYLTAGFALETLKTTDSMGHFGNTLITSVSASTTEPGVAAGLGFEYGVTDNVTVRAEYLYVNVKSAMPIIPATPGNADSITVSHAYTDNILRAGLNFKFGNWWY